MVQEYQIQKCNSGGYGGGGGGDGGSGGGGGGEGDGGGINFKSMNRKPKQKKVPQRGLGVAQLEKIRIEEQQMKDPSSSPPINRQFQWNPNFVNQSSSTPPRTDFASLNSTSCSTPWWPSSITGHENAPKIWSSCIEKENPGGIFEPGLLNFRSNLDLPYELSPIWPLLGSMQRGAQQYQAHSTSMVHILSASSSSSIEPPSNQSYCGNYTPMWPEEEKKVVGKKRPYPFALDNPSGPFIQYKFPSVVHHHNGSRSDDLVSCVNGAKVSFEPCNTSYRDGYGPSCSTSLGEKSTKENGTYDGDFLTLAPPTTPTTSGLTLKDLSAANQAFFNEKFPNLDSLLPYYQGRNTEDFQQHSYHGFRPPELMTTTHVFDQPPPTSMVNCDGEIGENVDLNLKL